MLAAPEKFSPCLFWGDESAVNKERNRNMLSYVFFSIVCELPGFLNYILVFIQRREWQIVRSTEHVALEVLVWSCNAFMTGKWPTHNHLDVAFTPKDGYRYTLAGEDLVPDGSRCVGFHIIRRWTNARWLPVRGFPHYPPVDQR